jgi:hypothetical protein
LRDIAPSDRSAPPPMAGDIDRPQGAHADKHDPEHEHNVRQIARVVTGSLLTVTTLYHRMTPCQQRCRTQ